MDIYENNYEESILDKCRNCPYFSESLSDMGWCDKTGGNIQMFGDCTDYVDGCIPGNEYVINGKKKSTKRSRAEKYKKHLKYLSSMPYYPSGAYIVDHYWCNCYEVPIDKPYYKRYWIGNGNRSGKSRTKFLKNQSDKKIRKYKHWLPNGGTYKKIFDYWWELL